MNKGTKRPDAAVSARLRAIPSVDIMLRMPQALLLTSRHGEQLVKTILKSHVSEIREHIIAGGEADTDPDAILDECGKLLAEFLKPRLRRAVNATGIILHTGLGRAPIPQTASDMIANCTGFCNLQTDLDSGKRGSREANLSDYVRMLTGAEDAIAVNNNAGATLLTLKALAAGREVVVSRGELIEIGGSFRLPDIMEESGAILREVGTTNKTHARDYEAAANSQTAVLFKAHKSNYSIVGFSKEVSISEIAEIGNRLGITVVDDLGCGALVPMEKYGLPHETTVRESLEAGADIALFSTDKLIGGPQGGMIAGKKKYIDIIRRDPLYRILRICKLTLAGLEGTLSLFSQQELLESRHPLYASLSRSPGNIKDRTSQLADSVAKLKPQWQVSPVQTAALLGGGALPGSELVSFGVKIIPTGKSAENLSFNLRNFSTPVFGRIEKNALILDMRTVSIEDESIILEALAAS